MTPRATEMPAATNETKTKKALVIIDMSVEQVAGIHYRKKNVIHTIRQLATASFFDLVIDSHLWMGPNDVSSLKQLYPGGQIDTEEARLIPELQGVFSRPSTEAPASSAPRTMFVRKYNYSSFAPPSILNETLQSHRITDVYLCGINTDYCVYATSLDAFYSNYNAFVVEEGVSSFNGAAGHKQGLEQIDKFGCATVVSVEDIVGNRDS
mmetsp:Transcript_23878/g.44116  ORF Transcript_23878/g.44116 Transcript_23878/m.44116 type:complete len:209 (-) Transcript_23878:166-792(-)